MSPSISFSLLSLLLLSIFPFHGCSATAQDLIQTTCEACSQDDPNVKYTFCTTSLQSAPASQCAGDVHGLGMISIKLVRLNVTDTRGHIKQLLKNKTLGQYVERCLSGCFDLYSNAIPSAKQAMEYYDLERYVEANVELSTVMDAATTCEDGFRERRGVVSPLTKRNSDTFELSAMALSIMHMLQTGSLPSQY